MRTMRCDSAGWVLLSLVAFMAGCNKKPRAPVLQDLPVYQNQQEGFRFQKPDGWLMRSLSEPPSGPLTQERLLVEYRGTQGAETASLVVFMGDVAEDVDLTTYLDERARKAKNGERTEKPETVDVGGRPGLRAVYEAKQKNFTALTEVIAVRRGQRVYFFTGGFDGTDRRSREQFRKAIATMKWS